MDLLPESAPINKDPGPRKRRGKSGRRKGTDVLLQMLPEIRRRANFVVRLVGTVDAGIRADIESRASWVEVLGTASDEKLREVCRSAAMLVNPSMLDSFGPVNQEAALEGTPVNLLSAYLSGRGAVRDKDDAPIRAALAALRRR